MYSLIETSAGYAVFKLGKDIDSIDNIHKFFAQDSLKKLVTLEKFVKFKDTKEGVKESLALSEGKVTKTLQKLIKKLGIVGLGEKLIVTDNKLGRELHEKLGVSVVSNSKGVNLRNCIIQQFEQLTGIEYTDKFRTSLGLSHSINRYKLKCNPDKIDTMIVQASSMLEDLDKELNNYVMRCKEMYGWHFPELAKTITNNEVYVDLVMLVGFRDNCLKMDMSSVLGEDLIESVRDAARISCGTSLSEDDLQNILRLCAVIKRVSASRAKLYEYLKNRMNAVAPNLTVLIGELLGAKLISKAGTLMNLAKQPSSTVQILGAEKALFRAMKTHQATPKYGLLYHAQIISSTNSDCKGAASRMLANSIALCSRKDAFDEDEECTPDLGVKLLAKLNNNLKSRESGNRKRPMNGTGKEGVPSKKMRFD